MPRRSRSRSGRVVLCAGLWLGGHPGKLPDSLRDAFVDETAGLNAEATELIEDNYFREVGADELTNASLQGMVGELRQRYDDRFSDYFSPEAWRSSTRRSPAASPASGSGHRGQARASGRPGLPGLAGRAGRIEAAT